MILNGKSKLKCISKLFSESLTFLCELPGERPFDCTYCDAKFPYISSLKQHLVTHGTERPYMCSECGEGFNSPSNLKQHRRVHGDTKEFDCEVSLSAGAILQEVTGRKGYSC